MIKRDDSGHIIPREKAGYNERLFNTGIRKNYHEARFHWLQHKLRNLQISSGSFVELGCFDARSLLYIPFDPTNYLGFDANWENGLDLAKFHWAGKNNFSFRNCSSPADFRLPAKSFDYGICLETLEHLPENELENYLQQLQLSVRHKIFITVPVEMGPLALLKYWYKATFLAVDEPYTKRELWPLLWGRLHKIERVPLGHKGFDYRKLRKTLEQYFHIESETGLPFTGFPVTFNLSCAFVLHPL